MFLASTELKISNATISDNLEMPNRKNAIREHKLLSTCDVSLVPISAPHAIYFCVCVENL